ncbi:sensor histidine kinase [Paenibacillus spongiae]|uniref:histidine kinase n=1 Tax=Paenibacillus spongiae TaxID=2909671 RepID=A0ABY5SFW4_9BACL|nr:HAMP domain-containing sensor histidine kinase [Paenibacillus spongiae]UVI32887.1 HAMP domain-containing histidine kinase [Paenibacillus spongiae]
MRNRIWNFLIGRRSIRIQMLWAYVLSLIFTLISSYLLNLVLDAYLTDFLYSLASTALFFFLFIFFFYIWTRRIMSYFRTITAGLKSIAGGNLSYRIPLARQDELGNVAQNVNHMAGQLNQQLEKERLLEKSKMELITYVSHDLRTPLTSIMGYLDLLKSPALLTEKEQERFIGNAYNKTQQLKKLIDDLFEYTRLTNGDALLVFQEIDFTSLLEQIISEFEPVAKEQHIAILSDIKPVPVMLRLDSEKMVRAIDNLLTNAMKFSARPGQIHVRLSMVKQRAILSVENFGNPITSEQEQQLFERFYKMEPSRNDANWPSGSGLGLPIAKNIVELHGGQIWLEHANGHYKFSIGMDAATNSKGNLPALPSHPATLP